MPMIVDAGKLKDAIKQCIEEINDACLELRQDGVTVLLPEFVDFEVNMVTNGDINVVPRAVTRSDAGGTQTMLREQLDDDTEQVIKTGGGGTVTRTPTGTATEQVIKTGGGGTVTRTPTGTATEKTIKSGGTVTINRQPQGAQEQTTTISHPGVQTNQGGGDYSKETVKYEYDD